MAVTGKVEGGGEVGFDLVERGRGGAEPFLDASELAGDALLLTGDEVEWHRAAVDGFDQLVPLGGELGFLAGELLVLALGVVAAGGQFGAEPVFHRVAQLWVEPDGRPVVFDHLLDLGDEQGLAGAGGGLHVSAQAHEVGVDDAVAVLGVGDDQSAAAGAAEDAGFEVVRVVSLPLSHEVGSQYVLDALPGNRVDQWLVGALVDHASVDDLALVVGVGQDGVQHVRPHRARGQLGCPAGREPPGLQLIGQ